MKWIYEILIYAGWIWAGLIGVFLLLKPRMNHQDTKSTRQAPGD